MKKKLEAELISIAHRILQHKNKSALPQLRDEARELYEKLAILSFAESHLTGPQPTIGQITTAIDQETENKEEEIKKPEIKAVLNPEDQINAPEKAKESKVTTFSEKEKKPEATEIKEPQKPEIFIEEINAKVTTKDLFVPATTITEETVSLSEAMYEKNDKELIGGATQSMPIMDTVNDTEEKPKSINDQLKKGIHIGLNDRLAFIKHLFDGSSADYNRVLSQLNTLNSKDEAREFIKNMVKPDYSNWKGKEEYEERFIDIVLSKFEY